MTEFLKCDIIHVGDLLMKTMCIGDKFKIQCYKHNKKIHRETHPNEKVQRNYITFTFNDISKLYDVNISMCISIVGKDENSNMFIPMAVLRFDKVIEHYLIRYINLCSKLNQNYGGTRTG